MNDADTVANLDEKYQSAVGRNDAETMGRILADDFVLVTGSGKNYSRADLLQEAKSGRLQYEKQESSQRIIRVWGDTAVVTALLWAKGTEEGKPFEYHVWFSDTYVRIHGKWHYALGQSGARLP